MQRTAYRAGYLIVLLCLAACGAPGPIDKTTGVRLYDFDGAPVTMICPPDRMIVMNFWTTWCPPCRIEVGHLLELQDEFREQGFDIVGILLDSLLPKHLKGLVEELNITYPVYVGDMVTIVAKTGVASVPAIIIVDSNGDIVKKLIGYHTKEELRAFVQETARARAASAERDG